MDPVTGIGLAAGIFQLLQCAESLVKTLTLLRQSADGVLKENSEIETTLSELTNLMNQLSCSDELTTSDNAKLKPICDMSTEVVKELLALLSGLKVTDVKKKWVVVKKTLKLMLKENDKKRLLDRLSYLQGQLTLHMHADTMRRIERMDKKLDIIVSTSCVEEVTSGVGSVVLCDTVVEVS